MKTVLKIKWPYTHTNDIYCEQEIWFACPSLKLEFNQGLFGIIDF